MFINFINTFLKDDSTSISSNWNMLIFKCDFDSLKFYITVEDKSLSTRVGTSIGTGNYAQAYFDNLHKI